MFAISNAELSSCLPATKVVNCRRCGGNHPVEYGERIFPNGKNEIYYLLGFYRCKGESYLYSIDSREVVCI